MIYLLNVISIGLLVATICIVVMKYIQLSEQIIQLQKTLTDDSNKPDECSARTFTIYTTFRVTEFKRCDGKIMYDVQYRNPSDTKWKVCRCKDTYNEAHDEMLELIDRINKDEF